MPYTELLKDEVDSLNTTNVFYITGKYFFCSVGPKLKIPKEPRLLYFAYWKISTVQHYFLVVNKILLLLIYRLYEYDFLPDDELLANPLHYNDYIYALGMYDWALMAKYQLSHQVRC